MKKPDHNSTINEEWKFLASCLSDGDGQPLSDIQLKEMKRAFFMGALAFFEKTMELGTAYPNRPALQAAKIAQWHREMVGFVQSVIEKHPSV